MGGPQNKFGATLRLSKLLNNKCEALITFINKLLAPYNCEERSGPLFLLARSARLHLG
jgi:hypothetical protein